ncbi:MAG TPA: GSCFA domain-containing protein, partial [Puia sp.]|nr:GSCFA domain-containing protein [Puia sp.]
LQNPNGILFDPASVATSLISYIRPQHYGEEDLVFFNELWQSWQHHSIFSHVDRDQCLAAVNASQVRAHAFLREADWLVITLGSAWSYRLVDGGAAVANCHRAPAQTFYKHLMTIEEINTALDSCLHQLFYFNPNLQVLFTVSPVRHIRDGVVDNNRSKARLIESVHHLVGKFNRLFYFPAYELVVDVLRDYRFFDIDMVHPNYPATAFVLEKFVQHCVDEPGRRLLEEIKKIVIARRHKPFQPSTQAHRRFLQDHWQKTAELIRQYPFLDLTEELDYFSEGRG